MPEAAPRWCPRCCAAHAAGAKCPAAAADKLERDRLYRQSAARRGYDSTWWKVRRAFLSQHPLCEDCQAAGRVRTADQVHHVKKVADRPDLRLDPSNLMSLCRSCHATRTARGE